MEGMDVKEKLKDDFPFLERKINGKRLVYLDNAATSQRPIQVIEAVSDFYKYHNANIHRGIHTLSMEATQMYEEARKKVAEFVGAKSPEQLIFTYGTTSSINFLAFSLFESGILGEGDTVLLTRVEHHANLLPWQRLKRWGVNLRFVEADENGVLRIDDILESMDGVKLVSITGLSNVTGQKVNVEPILEKAKKLGVLVHVDGAQLIPHSPIDVSEMGIDFLSFSAHKMLGPTGIGALYISENLLNVLGPFLVGGGMIDKVRLEEATFANPPERFEAGTPHIAGAVGFAKAVEYLENIGMNEVFSHSKRITDYTLEKLEELDFVRVFGPKDDSHVSIVSFAVEGVHPHDVAYILDQEFGVAIRTGHHCAQPLMRRLGVSATCRASFYLYNDEDDVDILVEGLRRVREWIG